MAGNDLSAVKRYMRVEGEQDDAVIQALYSAAEVYLANAGVGKPSRADPLYELALWSLTLHYYDHRDAVGAEAGLPTGLRPILNQLKLMANLDTEGRR